jgi:hypothetical protein
MGFAALNPSDELDGWPPIKARDQEPRFQLLNRIESTIPVVTTGYFE